MRNHETDPRMPNRRRAMRAVVVVAGAAMTAAVIPAPSAGADPPRKATKASMKYQDQPNGERQCSNCQQFRPPSSCEVVEGVISPQGYCLAWTRKA